MPLDKMSRLTHNNFYLIWRLDEPWTAQATMQSLTLPAECFLFPGLCEGEWGSLVRKSIQFTVTFETQT